MDIYITDLETGDRFRFPMLPQAMSVQTGAMFQSYNIMSIGEIKIPMGESLTKFCWDAMLPGKMRENEPYVKEWIDPHETQSMWSFWRVKKKKLRLLVTETPINHDVYLEDYKVDYKYGFGDYYYQISFVHGKDNKVYRDGEAEVGKSDLENKPANGSARPSPPPSKTYTVKSGDSLWAIAQRTLGAGAEYDKIYTLNKSTIGSDPNKILPGQVLSLPEAVA